MNSPCQFEGEGWTVRERPTPATPRTSHYASPMRSSLFPRLLLSVFLALGLSMGGCDTFSSDSSPAWTGDWEITELPYGRTPGNNTYFTFTEDDLTVVVEEEFTDGGDGSCNIYRHDIVNTDGNTVTIKFGDGLETDSLAVSNDSLTSTIIRSNTSQLEGETYKGVSVDTDPKELVGRGCERSGAKRGGAHPFK